MPTPNEPLQAGASGKPTDFAQVGGGFANAHTHLYSGLAPFGMPAPEPTPTSFVEILERVWWRLDRALDERALRASAEWYVTEALSLGTVALIDHHESPAFIEGSLDVLAEVCERHGMRALLCYGITERNGGADEARRGLAENERFLAKLAVEPSPLLRGGVGIHAGFTVSDESLREAAALAAKYKAPLHIHVAEDATDGDDARRRGYAGIIDRLDKTGVLTPGAILAHGVHLEDREVKLAAERGVWFVQNPRSNTNNGVGQATVLERANLADRVALGTDGFPADMRAEAATLEVDTLRAQRLATSRKLAAQLFGNLPPVTPPAPDQLEAAKQAAQPEATRLWARMLSL